MARASAFSGKRPVVFQVSGNIPNPFKALFYFRRIAEAGTNPPPNPCNPAWHGQVVCQFGNNNWIAVRVEKAKREGQPLPAGSYRNDVQQKDE
ncbi:MAG: hypothetical protein C5B58_01040 [Acidobacteria bacterium]|nr:MAG: hypothetical protein C5B58_01040 [Acidobacteriota bacterium]